MFERQKGMSIFSFLVVLIIAGVAFDAGMKLFTPYADHKIIVSILNNIVTDQDELDKSVYELRQDISKRLVINQVKLEKGALKIKETQGDLHFDLAYESRVPMYWNLDAVAKFSESWVATKP